MNKSDSIKEIAVALGLFQSAVETIPLDAEGYNYKYATLGNIINTIREPLKANSLSFTQLVNEDLSVTTILMHKSGEYLSSTIKINSVDKKGKEDLSAQGSGSAITYAKRYALTAILGVVGEEDLDGSDLEGKEPPKELSLLSHERYEKLIIKGDKKSLQTCLDNNGNSKIKNAYTLTEHMIKEITQTIVDMELKEQNERERANN